MARSPSHAAYTVLFQEMLDEFKAEPTRPFVIPCVDQKHANGMRLEWYGFKKSYIKHPENFPNYYKDIEAIGCRIINEDNKWRLELSHKDNDTVAQTLQAALMQHRAARMAEQTKDAFNQAGATTPASTLGEVIGENLSDKDMQATGHAGPQSGQEDDAGAGLDDGYTFRPSRPYRPNGNDEHSTQH